MPLLIALLLLLAPLAAVEPAPGDTCSFARRMAWCHYVAWFHPADPQHVAGRYYDQPLAPAALDRVAARRGEVATALAAGIDGFMVDLVGRPRPGRTGYVADLEEMLRAAEGTPFLVGGCLDVSNPDLDWQVEELADIVARLCRHPNYPRIGGRPLFASYGSTGRTAAQWGQVRAGLLARGIDIALIGDLGGGFSRPDAAQVAERAAAFDMLYLFSAYPHLPAADQAAWSTAETFARLGGWTTAAGRPWMATLWPGYLGGWLNGRNDYHQPFRGIDVLWECGMALDPGRETWVHLCTWNDHDETTLAPTAIAGDGRLALASAFLRRWRGGEPADEAPRVVAAYHREHPVGTTLRIEVAGIPGRSRADLAVSGALRDPQGAVLAELPERRLAGDAFARAEWLLPTAGLGSAAAWTPELRVRTAGGPAGAPTPLPAILPVQGWLADGGTVAVAVDRYAAATAHLTVAADGERCAARLAVAAGEAVRSATLWRNNRCLARFSAAEEAPVLHLELSLQRPLRLALEVERGGLLEANGRGGLGRLALSPTGMHGRHERSWGPIGLTLAGGSDLALRVQVDDLPPVILSRGDLCSGRTLAAGRGATVVLAQADPRGAAAPPLAGAAAAAPLSAGVWTRLLRPGDRFEARIELASGRLLWSPVATPLAGPPRELLILASDESIDHSRGFSGTRGERGFLAPPPANGPRLVPTLVHPAALRASAWDLADPCDRAGDRPLAALPAPRDGVLALDGATVLRLPARLVPLGAATIDLRLRPEALDGEQAVLTRRGDSSAISLRLAADGRLEALRDGDGITPVRLVAARPLAAGTWTRVRVACDERRLRLWLDGAPAGEADLLPGRAYGNATYELGAKERGFRGAIADLAILGWAEEP